MVITSSITGSHRVIHKTTPVIGVVFYVERSGNQTLLKVGYWAKLLCASIGKSLTFVSVSTNIKA